jgi:hypothetical protein
MRSHPVDLKNPADTVTYPVPLPVPAKLPISEQPPEPGIYRTATVREWQSKATAPED